MGQIAQRINTFIQRTGRHFMQQRLPQVAVVTIHQRDFRFLLRPSFPQLSRQFQSASTTTYNHDFFNGVVT
jgi:hypothetical protein